MIVGSVKVDIAPGELIDKITILSIKSERMKDLKKLENVRQELDILLETRDRAVQPSETLKALTLKLKEVNERLLTTEDSIRDCEAAGDFGARFIDLARAIYQNNDERASLKREINHLLGSQLIEEKSYKPY